MPASTQSESKDAGLTAFVLGDVETRGAVSCLVVPSSFVLTKLRCAQSRGYVRDAQFVQQGLRYRFDLGSKRVFSWQPSVQE